MTGRNRLADATSPYLLQHADNPVEWWPWCDEAFAEAERRDVPVFLSVGYAACHWCHVMAHESFEDPQIAALLAEHFVSIKVDREERPDVDAVYMQATQAMTGQGGWPMSVFLTPDRRPFYAGTYFPPVPRHGMPSFPQLLEALAGAWRDRRAEIVSSADTIVSQLAERRIAAVPGILDAEACRAAVAVLEREFDAQHAGFGGAPKFPPSMVLEALLRDGGPEATAMATATLTAMADGGIYDQLAGGFARYSVDAGWVVPHFEKMLYDNALLLGVYTHAWRRTGDPSAARVVAETVDWLRQEMTTPEGGFAASLDADSLDTDGHTHEGAFYVWTPAQLVEVLGPEDGTWAAAAFGVTERGTFEAGASTLRRIAVDDEERLARVRDRLRTARERRARPARDDKVVTAWNGWLIDALVQAALVFERPDWLEVATDAAEAIWQRHVVDGRLRRASRGGVVGTAAAILEDYGALTQAAVRLAAAHADPRWLERAERLAAVMIDVFDDGGEGFFDTAVDAEELYTRPQDPTDNATPSGLSSAVHALALLGELTGEPRYTDRAEAAAHSAGAIAERAPRFAGWLLADAITRTTGAVQVAVVGEAGPERHALVAAAHRLAPAGSVVLAGLPDQPGFALLADRSTTGGRPTAYVCRHFVCRLPVTDPEALAAQLAR